MPVVLAFPCSYLLQSGASVPPSQPVRLHLPQQRVARDPEHPGCRGPVPVRSFECVSDRVSLDLREGSDGRSCFGDRRLFLYRFRERREDLPQPTHADPGPIGCSSCNSVMHSDESLSTSFRRGASSHGTRPLPAPDHAAGVTVGSRSSRTQYAPQPAAHASSFCPRSERYRGLRVRRYRTRACSQSGRRDFCTTNYDSAHDCTIPGQGLHRSAAVRFPQNLETSRQRRGSSQKPRAGRS